MHDIWNPWHGCVKCSEGCRNCYMYFLDRKRAGKDGSEIRRNSKSLFNYPIARNRAGEYKIKSGERIRVCMTSDFFLAQADEWRGEAWDLIRSRPDVMFWLLTKRPQRILDALPPDWGQGWDNVMLNVTAEDQHNADWRVPAMLAVPARHYGVCVAPWIGPVSLEPWLDSLDEICGGGENYDGSRPCHHDWVASLREECVRHDRTFCFYETGTRLIKNGLEYFIPSKSEQSRQAYWSGLSYVSVGHAPAWTLKSPVDGHVLAPDELRRREFCPHCRECANRLICNGCSRCDNCGWGGLLEDGRPAGSDRQSDGGIIA